MVSPLSEVGRTGEAKAVSRVPQGRVKETRVDEPLYSLLYRISMRAWSGDLSGSPGRPTVQ